MELTCADSAEEKSVSGDMRIILHVDMDCFFAAVEVREHPELKGLPVIIGADPKGGTGRGVVSTASYEARAFGVHSAMPVSQAYRLCPQGIFCRGSRELYKSVSENIMSIISEYSEKFEQVSIDEAYLDMSHLKSFHAAKRAAEEIKERIYLQEGITCSVGIGKSKVIAKTGSDFQKPDGLTIVMPEDSEKFMRALKIGKIPGIGKKSQEILNGAGIETVADLIDCETQKLIDIVGRHAGMLKEFCRGNDSRPVEKRGECKSLGRERTYPEDTKDIDALYETVGFICGEIIREASDERISFKTVTVKIRYTGFITITRSETLFRHTNSLDVLYRTAAGLIDENLDRDKGVRLIGVSVSGFENRSGRQSRLYEYPKPVSYDVSDATAVCDDIAGYRMKRYGQGQTRLEW